MDRCSKAGGVGRNDFLAGDSAEKRLEHLCDLFPVLLHQTLTWVWAVSAPSLSVETAEVGKVHAPFWRMGKKITESPELGKS
jgi:hypothetical protein